MKKDWIKNFFSRFKYFGLRFLYYKIYRKWPWLKFKILDIHTPKLISRMISERLITLFNGEQGHGIPEKESDFLGLGLIHYSLIRITRPKRVLCIGSLRGFIPAICALACEDNGYGLVDFVDAGYGEESEKSWGADGFWKKVNPQRHFNQMRLTRIQTYVMTNKEFAKLFPKRTYDYIYIDGDHTYKGVKLDYRLYWPKLNKNGFMTFHDILGKGSINNAEFGVNSFWKDLTEKNKVDILFPKESGLGILQKK